MNLASPARQSWQTELASAFVQVDQLLEYLQLSELAPQVLANQPFAFKVTQAYAQRMRKGDPKDPLLRQVLPFADELAESEGFSADPVGDQAATVVPGVLHKYRGRVLLVTTGACAINCRYCFRREFPYSEGQLSRRREGEALAYIAADETVTEVILSGGDPLVLSDERWSELVGKIAAISHVSRLRIHTRLPVVLPSRVTAGLLDILTHSRLTIVMVIHVNHANEMDEEVALALAKLRGAGVHLLNQSVLLKGVNDTAKALSDLSVALMRSGVLPYYLHLLDRAPGTAHFDLPEEQAKALYEELRKQLPGYLVPRLVREIPGLPYKSLL